MAQLVRAPPCHGGGRGFESRLGRSGSLAQLDRALGYGPRCREFESSRARMLNSLKFLKNQGFKAIFVYADFMNPF